MIKYIRYNAFALFHLLLILGVTMHSYDLILVSIIVLWINNILFCCEDVKNRIFFLMFQICFFVFLLDRVLMRMIKGDIWWQVWGEQNVRFALIAVTISLLTMFYTALITCEYQNTHVKKKIVKKVSKHELEYKEDFRKMLQLVTMIVFFITMFFFLAEQAEKLLFMRGKEYVEFYTGFESKLPTVFHTIASFMVYSLCAFLATMPEKKKAYIPLALYVFSAIPMLIIGVRNPIVVNAIFAFLYFFLRDVIEHTHKWIGRVERIGIAIGAPFAIAFLGLYSVIRSGVSTGFSFFSSLLDFFYGQGVSFEVLAIGYGCIDRLPQRPFRNYTFGPFIDYVVHGTLGQHLFGTEALPSGNSIINALQSNSFAHNMSYIARNDYLEGHGWGSSYLLETYTDFGYIGLIVANVILTILLLYIIRMFGKNTLVNTIILTSLTQLYLLPRGDATGWLLFIITIQFWLCIGACYFTAALLTKSYEKKKVKKEERLGLLCLNTLG